MSFALGPFTPAGTVARAVTSGSSAVALPLKARDQVMVTNEGGGSTAFIEFGDSTVVASAGSSTPILSGAAYIFTINPNVTHMAAVTVSGSALVYATIGQGA